MKKNVKLIAILMILLMPFIFTACDGNVAEEFFYDNGNGGDGPTPPPAPAPVAVESVSLDKAALTLKTGEDGTLTATVLPENAADKSVTWSSNNNGVATVDQNGKVTGVTAGTATITVKTVDGEKTATCEVTVKAALPAGALAGKFTVNADGKKVHFSKGNLYYDGSKFNFEANQYDTTPASDVSWSADHISHFFWSKTASVAYAEGYIDGSASDSDVFFTNETVTTSKNDFTVNVGGTEQTGWRTLSTEEWQYLFNDRTVNGGTGAGKSYSCGITYGGKMGLVLYPDNYTGTVLSGAVDTLPDGVVFLPAAGSRVGSNVSNVGSDGYYWSATASGGGYAARLFFLGSSVNPASSDGCDIGCSVRLVVAEN